MKRIIVLMLTVLAFCSTAHAEWGLYVNRDNKGWQLERSFAFFEGMEGCKWAARELYNSGRALGTTCQEFVVEPRRAQVPAAAQPVQELSGGRGRKEAAIEFRQRALESAQEAARRNPGRPVYSNGDSYGSREVKDAARALQQERSK